MTRRPPKYVYEDDPFDGESFGCAVVLATMAIIFAVVVGAIVLLRWVF